MQPFVIGLDVPCRIAAEKVLERAEIDDRLPGIDLCRIAVGVAGEVLPPIEVHMGLEVRLPSILDGGLESDRKHAFGAKLLGELVRGERLAEAHFRVPEEARDGMHVLLPDGVEVGVRLVHGLGLLPAHRERKPHAATSSFEVDVDKFPAQS
jgi:hypothetical protein